MHCSHLEDELGKLEWAQFICGKARERGRLDGWKYLPWKYLWPCHKVKHCTKSQVRSLRIKVKFNWR